MLYLRQSTASQSVLIGPFVDKTNGADAETGLTIANTDIRLSKNGANMAAKNSGGGTHDEAGWYAITLDATDTNTVGRLQVSCHMTADALPVFAEFQVLEESIYDALFAASAAGFDANQRVNVGQWLSQAVTLSTGNLPDVNVAEISDSPTAADNCQLMFDGTGYAGGTTKLQVSLANAAHTIQQLVITGGSGHGIDITPATTSSGIYVRGGATSGEAVSLNSSGSSHALFLAAGGSGDGLNITSTSGDGIDIVVGGTDIKADITGNITGNLSGSVGSLTGHTAQTGDTYALASGATGFTAIDTVVDGIATTLGTPSNLGGGATVANNLSDMAGATFSTTTDTLEAIRNQGDAAWITATSVTVSDKTGFSLSAAGIDAIWDELTSGHSTPGSFAVAVTDILTDTSVIGAAGAGLTEAGGTGDHLTAIPWNAAWDAEVESEVVDALTTNTETELAAVPAASPNLHAMVQWVYMAHRNKVTSTATATTINNDAGSAIGTSTDSDNGTTFTRGEFA